MSRSFRDLIVWQKAIRLVVDVYGLTHKLPKHESYGLASQVQRAAVSIPSNIAEGSQRTGPDFRRFCSIAYGSAVELETQLYIIEEVYKIDCSSYLCKLEEVQKMLHMLMQKLSVTRNS